MHAELNTLALIIEVSVMIAFAAAWAAGGIWLVNRRWDR